MLERGIVMRLRLRLSLVVGRGLVGGIPDFLDQRGANDQVLLDQTWLNVPPHLKLHESLPTLPHSIAESLYSKEGSKSAATPSNPQRAKNLTPWAVPGRSPRARGLQWLVKRPVLPEASLSLKAQRPPAPLSPRCRQPRRHRPVSE